MADIHKITTINYIIAIILNVVLQKFLPSLYLLHNLLFQHKLHNMYISSLIQLKGDSHILWY